jgi:hypothetical protein
MPSLYIRFATSADEAAVRRLAALDSAPLPKAPLLVVEEDGELRAALSLATGRAVADPFARTADAVAMLRMRADQMAAAARADRARVHSGGRIPRSLRAHVS